MAMYLATSSRRYCAGLSGIAIVHTLGWSWHWDGDPEARQAMRDTLEVRLAGHICETIFAAWPEDFLFLFRLLAGDRRRDAILLDVAAVLLAAADPPGEGGVLEDARALMRWHAAHIAATATR